MAGTRRPLPGEIGHSFWSPGRPQLCELSWAVNTENLLFLELEFEAWGGSEAGGLLLQQTCGISFYIGICHLTLDMYSDYSVGKSINTCVLRSSLIKS